MFPCSQQNFPCDPVFPKSISLILVFPVLVKYAFVPVFPVLFSFCSHVPKKLMAVFPCSLKPVGEPHWKFQGGGAFQELKF